jgi:hypothetical protein
MFKKFLAPLDGVDNGFYVPAQSYTSLPTTYAKRCFEFKGLGTAGFRGTGFRGTGFRGAPGGPFPKRPPWVTTKNNTAESEKSSVFEGHPGELFPKKFP